MLSRLRAMAIKLASAADVDGETLEAIGDELVVAGITRQRFAEFVVQW